MLTSARILLMLILASFLVANSQGNQNPEVSTFNSEVSADLSYEISSDFLSDSSSESSSDSSTSALKIIDTDSSEISSDFNEASTQFDIFSGTEKIEEATSTEKPSGYLSLDTYTISPLMPITESSLSFEELADEVLASSDDNETPIDSLQEDLIETFTEFDQSSGMDDLSSQFITATLSSIQKENFTESDMFSGSEGVEMAQSGDISLEITNTPLPAVTVITEPEASTEVDMYSGSEEVEMANSSELSGDLSSEIDNASSSSSAPSTKSVFSLNVPRDVITASPDQEGITESVKPKESPDMPTTNKDFIFPSNSTDSIDLSDSVNLQEEQVSDASNTSKFVSETEPHEQKTSLGVLFGVIMGSIGAVASLATIAFMLYRRRKNNQFAHQRFFDDKNEPVLQLDNLNFGHPSFFSPTIPDDPVMEKSVEKTGETIRMTTFPIGHSLV